MFFKRELKFQLVVRQKTSLKVILPYVPYRNNYLRNETLLSAKKVSSSSVWNNSEDFFF